MLTVMLENDTKNVEIEDIFIEMTIHYMNINTQPKFEKSKTKISCITHKKQYFSLKAANGTKANGLTKYRQRAKICGAIFPMAMGLEHDWTYNTNFREFRLSMTLLLKVIFFLRNFWNFKIFPATDPI